MRILSNQCVVHRQALAASLPQDHLPYIVVDRRSGRSLSRFPGSGATQYLTTRARQHLCALLMMASSMFGAKQRISKPLSALAVHTGRHIEK
ncbi:predicted protein [Micromonas commoda]|uniref:Uncharacterized protein n=1 Tax=Micromonas commoda (strain RCC299 / NOUM17 / CCMP2709) TaxID=296587 RepID=C1EJL3_MICCC|nr:predicted protein [Micromonas commoda]ACO68207.1 predicted protein [Micromonas commoda]|eukprot:XP_002506949.1 predicted protein [Micromonas commoda]